VKLADLPPAYQEQARAQLDGERPAVTEESLSSVADDKAEKTLQTHCENWLIQREYRRLTAQNAESQRLAPVPIRGWFGHLQQSKRNPLMPDIFIFDGQGRCLLVELKAYNKWQPGQKEMVALGVWRTAWTFQGFVEIVTEWEAAA
jgi:hypothetical protein